MFESAAGTNVAWSITLRVKPTQVDPRAQVICNVVGAIGVPEITPVAVLKLSPSVGKDSRTTPEEGLT
jgi:hypothetical protein